LSGGPKFAEEFFDSKKGLFEPEELTDRTNTRYLARKTKDVPPHVPPFDEVRSDVKLAWQTAQARVLAEKTASDLAEQLRKKNVESIKDSVVDGFRVLTIPPLTRRQPRILPGQFDSEEPEETPLPDIQYPGDAFRDAYFNLQAGSIAVAPNQPKTVYYVMALDRRDPATFAALYAPYSDQRRYETTTRDHEVRHLDEEWMGWLRQQAGLKPDWVPPDEARTKALSDDA
jgi:peptidyl-prolyl cis-trans isomerase D